MRKAISDNKDRKQSFRNIQAEPPERPTPRRRSAAAVPRVRGPADPRPPVLGDPGRASRRPPIWQSPRRRSLPSSSRGVQNLSRPSVTRGTKTISRLLAPQAWARRGRRVDRGRAPRAAPFPGGRTGGLGTGGDTKKPERQTPPAGARSNPRSAPPADKFAAPSTHPALPSRAKFPGPGSDPRSGSGPVSSRPLPQLGDLALPGPRPFSSLPFFLPLRHSPLPLGRTGVQGPRRRRAHPLPARRGRGLLPARVSAPLALLLRSRLLLGLPLASLVQRKARGAAERARLLGARKAANHAPRLPRPPPSPALAARWPVSSPPASAGGGAATSPRTPRRSPGLATFLPRSGTSERL